MSLSTSCTTYGITQNIRLRKKSVPSQTWVSSLEGINHQLKLILLQTRLMFGSPYPLRGMPEGVRSCEMRPLELASCVQPMRETALGKIGYVS